MLIRVQNGFSCNLLRCFQLVGFTNSPCPSLPVGYIAPLRQCVFERPELSAPCANPRALRFCWRLNLPVMHACFPIPHTAHPPLVLSSFERRINARQPASSLREITSLPEHRPTLPSSPRPMFPGNLAISSAPSSSPLRTQLWKIGPRRWTSDLPTLRDHSAPNQSPVTSIVTTPNPTTPTVEWLHSRFEIE